MNAVATPARMRAVAVTGVQQLEELALDVPTCGAGEVLVHVGYVGICGSDVPRYFDGGVHAFPQVLGHEFSGVVAAVADGVSHVSPGDRVAVAPLVPCHACEQCLAGRPSLCPHYSFVGSRQQGAMAEYVSVPARNVVPVGDLDLRIAALIEPMTVALHGIGRVPFVPGVDAAVLGGGVIGLMSVIALRGLGAGSITVVDINPWVLEMARRFGATDTVDAANADVAAYFAAKPPSLVIETAGAAITRRQAIQVAAKAGSVVFVGTPTTDVTLDPETFEHILRKELTLRGSWMSYSAPFPGEEWVQAPRLLAEAAEDPRLIVTHEFPLDEVAAGFAVMRSREAARLKVMFKVGEPDA